MKAFHSLRGPFIFDSAPPRETSTTKVDDSQPSRFGLLSKLPLKPQFMEIMLDLVLIL